MSRRWLIWYWSATGGGGSQYAVNLARRLTKRFGAEAIKLSLHADDPLLARALEQPFETRATQVATNRRKPVSTLLSLGDSARVLAEHARDCDAVLLPMNFASAAPLALGLQKPLIYFAHDPAPHPGDYAELAQRTTQAMLMARATRIVALSHYAAGELERIGVSKNRIVNAPLNAVFEPQTNRPRSAGPMRLLFAGRMMAYKGADLLADALLKLAERDDWRLTVAGDGPVLDAAMRARFQNGGIELLPGWMSEATLDELIASCDILLAPYRSATQSGVVAQALAHGRPCIVTPVGALPEQIGAGAAGWVTPAVDAQSLAEILVRVLKDDKAWGEKARGAAEVAARATGDEHWAWLDAI